MRKFVAVVLLMFVGAASGIGLAIAEYGRFPTSGDELIRPTSVNLREAKSIPIEERPRILVQSLDYDFGTMEFGTTRSHDFPVKNDGFVPLKLEMGGTSCSCTLGGLESDTLQPGQSTNVTLTWTAKTTLSGFRHTAKILTNDPTSPEIEFAIHGKVIESIEVLPLLVRFDKPDEDEWSTEVKVISTVLPDLQLTGYRLEDSATADKFTVEMQKATPDNADIKSQWSVKVTVKPGLPLGRVEQKILLQTNFADRPELEISISGKVEQNLRVFGGRWNEATGSLNLGQVSSAQGAVGEVKVLARGDHRDRIKLKVKEVTPDYLKVEVGEAQSLAGGERLHIPIKITIPPGAPISSFLGTAVSPLADVVLETGDPDQPELHVKLNFAVSK